MWGNWNLVFEILNHSYGGSGGAKLGLWYILLAQLINSVYHLRKSLSRVPPTNARDRASIRLSYMSCPL